MMIRNLILFAITLASASAQNNNTVSLLVQTEHIELDKKVFHSFLYGKNFEKSGNELRSELQLMIKNGNAKMIHSTLGTMTNGEESVTESTKAVIYPTYYDPAEITPTQIHKSGAIIKETASGPTPSALEERPIGSRLECRASYDAERKLVSLKMESSLSYYTGETVFATWKDKFGEANTSMPQFYQMELETTLELKSNTYHLAAVMTPKGKDGKSAMDKKVVVFVRAVVMGAK